MYKMEKEAADEKAEPSQPSQYVYDTREIIRLPSYQQSNTDVHKFTQAHKRGHRIPKRCTGAQDVQDDDVCAG